MLSWYSTLMLNCFKCIFVLNGVVLTCIRDYHGSSVHNIGAVWSWQCIWLTWHHPRKSYDNCIGSTESFIDFKYWIWLTYILRKRKDYLSIKVFSWDYFMNKKLHSFYCCGVLFHWLALDSYLELNPTFYT